MKPGPLLIYGSGATTAPSSTLFRMYLSSLPKRARIALVETPAGFQPNSHALIQEVSDSFKKSMPEFIDTITIIEARSVEDEINSPNNPEIAGQVSDVDVIYLGAGSPTYTVRHLQGSMLWKQILQSWKSGAMLLFSSAATIAIGAQALPVYEIYKVGDSLHWKQGLNLLQDYMPPIAFIAHWNNTDGGKELDTSRCYVGKSRFEKLSQILSPSTQVLGIDEHTGIIIDLHRSLCICWGKGCAYLVRDGQTFTLRSENAYDLHSFKHRAVFSLHEYFIPLHKNTQISTSQEITPQIQKLIQERQEARRDKDFAKADAIREKLIREGIDIADEAII